MTPENKDVAGLLPSSEGAVTVEAVAKVVLTNDGLDLEWLIEGGISAMVEGETLLICAERLTDEYGSGEVYLAAPSARAAFWVDPETVEGVKETGFLYNVEIHGTSRADLVPVYLAAPGAAIAAREQTGDAWQPIETAKKHGDPVWLFDPALIDADANPTGTVDGHWQDDEGWKGAVWSMHFNEWRIETINPTHWMARSMPVPALASREEAPVASGELTDEQLDAALPADVQRSARGHQKRWRAYARTVLALAAQKGGA